MNLSGGNEEDFSGLCRSGWLAVGNQGYGALLYVSEKVTGMSVARLLRSGGKYGLYEHTFASGNAEVVALKDSAGCALLGVRDRLNENRQPSGEANKNHDGKQSQSVHGNLLTRSESCY
jgi:hypothetical protein